MKTANMKKLLWAMFIQEPNLKTPENFIPEMSMFHMNIGTVITYKGKILFDSRVLMSNI